MGKDTSNSKKLNATPAQHVIIAMTQAAEQELVITHTSYNSRYGPLFVAASTQGISFIGFGNEQQMLDELKERYPSAEIIRGVMPILKRVLALVEDPRKEDALPLHIKGTTFQLRVWQELLQIPCGNTSSYSTIAEQIGRSGAARAVGSAVGRNPVACLIPCHRVVRADNSLGEYHWGTSLKAQLLSNEAGSHH